MSDFDLPQVALHNARASALFLRWAGRKMRFPLLPRRAPHRHCPCCVRDMRPPPRSTVVPSNSGPSLINRSGPQAPRRPATGGTYTWKSALWGSSGKLLSPHPAIPLLCASRECPRGKHSRALTRPLRLRRRAACPPRCVHPYKFDVRADASSRGAVLMCGYSASRLSQHPVRAQGESKRRSL